MSSVDIITGDFVVICSPSDSEPYIVRDLDNNVLYYPTIDDAIEIAIGLQLKATKRETYSAKKSEPYKRSKSFVIRHRINDESYIIRDSDNNIIHWTYIDDAIEECLSFENYKEYSVERFKIDMEE